ncbi:hypothetical protein [Nocardia sp. NPDC002869]
MITDPTLTRIGEAVTLHHHQGQRAAAHEMFTQIWSPTSGRRRPG